MVFTLVRLNYIPRVGLVYNSLPKGSAAGAFRRCGFSKKPELRWIEQLKIDGCRHRVGALCIEWQRPTLMV